MHGRTLYAVSQIEQHLDVMMLQDLSVRCTLRDHEARPTFPALQEELAVLQAALRRQPMH